VFVYFVLVLHHKDLQFKQNGIDWKHVFLFIPILLQDLTVHSGLKSWITFPNHMFVLHILNTFVTMSCTGNKRHMAWLTIQTEMMVQYNCFCCCNFLSYTIAASNQSSIQFVKIYFRYLVKLYSHLEHVHALGC